MILGSFYPNLILSGKLLALQSIAKANIFCRHHLAIGSHASLDSLVQLLPATNIAHGDTASHSIAWLVD